MIQLSIIIPVYNVEKYLRKCLDSVFEQEGQELDYEVIVVNDGSPDNSQSIIDEYASKHSNCVVVNQKNQGLSAARNAGLRLAQGKYVWFIDSDDYITDNAIPTIISYIHHHNEVEVFTFSVIGENEHNGERSKLFQGVTAKRFEKYCNTIHSGAFLHKKIHLGLVQKNVFNRNFLIENKLYFTPGIYHEDMEYMVKIDLYAQRIMPLEEYLYVYLLRSSGSITTSSSLKHYQDRLTIIHNLLSLSRSFKGTQRRRAILIDAVFDYSFSLLYDKHKTENEKYRSFIDSHKKELINYCANCYFNSIFYYHNPQKIFKIFPVFRDISTLYLQK